jgi:DDE superfamily endonuclease
MLDLPKKIIQELRQFEGECSERIWEWAKVLLIGAILSPGRRTVTEALRVMGLHNDPQFQNSHRVLNRARWSSRALSRILLHLVVKIFVPTDAPIVVGIDETIERRRGAKIAAKGISRDPVRSSKAFFVKTSGLRWVSMMLLTPIPWAQRVWALPFLTVLAPSKRYAEDRKRRHKKMTDWGRQMIRQLRRWLPGRYLVVVADSSYAVLDLVACAAGWREPVTVVTRLRLDAALYDPASERKPGTNGRPRLKGARQPTLAQRLVDPKTPWQTLTLPWYGGQTRTLDVATGTAVWYHTGLPPVAIRWVMLRDPHGQFPAQALLSTDQSVAPTQMIAWFVLRCWGEVTFHEVRTYLGVETQRQWSDLAILRTTPALLGLFSLVTIFASRLLEEQALPTRQAAWYSKALPTFSDTLAFVRVHLWPVTLSSLSPAKPAMVQIPRALFERLTETLAFVA